MPTVVNSSGSYSSASNSNPYAQPIRATRSHSMTGREDSIKLKAKSKKKGSTQTSSTVSNMATAATGNSQPPPIPEPDYSLSESEPDGEEESDKEVEEKTLPKAETSGNSNASSGSSSSSTLPHSFSVEEIQKVRTQLKSSKSYPNDFLVLNPMSNAGAVSEDGDNSSSGVSSDQDIPVGPPCGFDDTRSSEGSGGSTAEEHAHQSEFAGKQQSLCTTLPSRQRVVTISGGMLTRNAVSLAQLPPPLEGEAEGEGDLVVPPPPEFLGSVAGNNNGEEVLAPPPQFSDNRLVTRVRIVGAVPKPGASTGSARLHSQ